MKPKLTTRKWAEWAAERDLLYDSKGRVRRPNRAEREFLKEPFKHEYPEGWVFVISGANQPPRGTALYDNVRDNVVKLMKKKWQAKK